MCLEEINLIESKKKFRYHSAQCKKQKTEKTNTKNRRIAGNKVHKRKRNKQLNTKWNRFVSELFQLKYEYFFPCFLQSSCKTKCIAA